MSGRGGRSSYTEPEGYSGDYCGLVSLSITDVVVRLSLLWRSGLGNK